MRHSFDSILLDNEVNYVNVSACLGHTLSDSLTTRRYYHPKDYVEQVNKFWDNNIKIDVSKYL